MKYKNIFFHVKYVLDLTFGRIEERDTAFPTSSPQSYCRLKTWFDRETKLPTQNLHEWSLYAYSIWRERENKRER